MIALDTNVLVRFLVQDEPDQARLAVDVMEALTEACPGFVCREVLVELVRVLERAYGRPRTEIATAFDALLSARELVIEASEDVGPAIDRYRGGGHGFADLMIAAAVRRAGAMEFVTFDRRAAGLPRGRLLG